MSRAATRASLSAVTFSLILAACGQASADVPSPSHSPTGPASPSPSPSEPVATPRPTPDATPTPEPQPTEEPTAVPQPPAPTVVRHELPMVGRVTVDGVAVRELPDLQAPLVTGSSATDEYEEFPSLRVDAGDLVVVTLGPVYADGLSWYYVHPGGGPVNFLGWIAGEYLARDGDYARSFGTIDGIGSGGTLEVVNIRATAPMVVNFGVNVVDGRDGCHFSADVVRGDGSVVAVWDGDVDGPMVGRVGPQDADLVQTVDGTMTLRVETDCTFSATMGISGH